MSTSNLTGFPSLTFLLTGFPGLGAAPSWLALPICTLFLLSAVGNGTVVFIILTEPSLHAPMYLFLLMLAVSDLGLSTALLPTVLSLFLFGHREVSAGACFSQLFFIHTFSIMESSVLLAMAFDRFVAICKPLRYPSILTRTRVVQIGIAIAVRSIVLHLPLPFLLHGQRYCWPHVLSHSYCLHPDVMKLACTNAHYSSYGLFVVFSTMGLDPVFIVLSYTWILKSVLSIMSVEDRIKALNTCASHISVVVIFYTPMLVLSLINRLGLHVVPFIHILLSFLHFLVPPVLNPLLYCVKMKEVRGHIASRLLRSQRVHSMH